MFLTVGDEEMYEKVLGIVLEALESRHGVFGYIDPEGSLVCPSMTREIFSPVSDVRGGHGLSGGLLVGNLGRELEDETVVGFESVG